MHSDSDHMDFYDIALVLVKNIKLLVVGPLLAGALALIFVSLAPEQYKSEAILLLPPDGQLKAEAMLASVQKLDSVIRQLNLSLTQADFSKSVRVNRGRDGLLRLTVVANSPLEAQKRASALVSVWIQSESLGDKDRAALEKKLQQIRHEYTAVVRGIEELALIRVEREQSAARPDNQAAFKLMAAQADYVSEILHISQALDYDPKAAVVQQPTLPVAPASSKKELVVAASLLIVFGLLLLWVFVRHSWETASRTPGLLEKQEKLIAALRFKLR